MERLVLSEERKLRIGTKCINCGSTEDLTYHHVIPLSIGGNDIDSNIVCLCGCCHKKLHNITDGDYIAHSLLIKNGIKRARKKGTTIGRPKTGVPNEFKTEFMKFLNKEGIYNKCTASHFAFLNDIAISTYYKYVGILKEDAVWNELIASKTT